MKGRVFSVEHRKKLSESMSVARSPMSMACRKKISVSHLGIRPSEEVKLKISSRVKEALANNMIKKKLRWRVGLSKETDERVAKHSVRMKLYWSTKTREDKLKHLEPALKVLLSHIKPNKPEQLLESILCDYFPNQWMFVGDGKLIIDRLIPDFANVNGKKQVIEVYGDYWHKNQEPNNRICRFAKFGYDCLVIWEHELKSNQVEKTISKIKSFVREQND